MSYHSCIELIHVSESTKTCFKSFSHAWVLCSNYVDFFKYKKKIPKDLKLISVGNVVNQLAGRLSFDIINIDDTLVREAFYDSWLASCMGEKNPCTSDFILNIYQAIALIEAARSGGKHLVILDDWFFGSALIKTLKNNNVHASWHNNNRPHNFYSFNVIKTLASATKFMIKQSFISKREQKKKSIYDRPILLLSWITADSFPSTKQKTTDACFGALPEWIRGFSKTPFWLGNPTTWVHSLSSIIKNTSNAHDPVITTLGLIKYYDILQAILIWFLFPLGVKKHLSLENCNLSEIVKFHIKKEWLSPQIIIAASSLNIAKRLKQRNIHPKVLFYTFENQPWEKMVLKSFRCFLPKVKLIGIQHAPFSDQYLSLFPSNRQWVERITPDILLVIGNKAKDQFIKYGSPINRVMVGGALRMSGFTKKQQTKFKVPIKNPRQQSYSILVTCPLEKNQAIEIASKSALSIMHINNIKMVINFHPLSEQSLINAVKSALNDIIKINNIVYSDQSVSSLLENVDLLIYNSSSTVFNAIHNRIPTLYVGPENGLDLNKFFPKKRAVCRNVKDIQVAIKAVIGRNTKSENLIDEKESLLVSYFSEPNKVLFKTLICD